tara:strand:- start:3995 stop:6955 length:2961 start_codon:yes stop_codon:yes gene_type:complete
MKRLLLEQLLQEFNKGDREEVERHGEDFGISYEIELESKIPIGECSEDADYARRRARVERAMEHLDSKHFFTEQLERESDSFFDDGIETGEDASELIDWYIRENNEDFNFLRLENDGQEIRMRNHILVSIGYNNNEGFEKRVRELLDNEEFAFVFFEMLRENEHILEHLEKFLEIDHEKKTKKTQRTSGDPFGTMGDEEVPIAGLEVLNIDQKINLFNQYVFNLESRTENFPVGSDTGGFGEATIDLFDLFEEANAEADYETIYEQGKSDIDSFFFDSYSTIKDIIKKQDEEDGPEINNWSGYFMASILTYVVNRMKEYCREAASDEQENFEWDPIDYLENQMGDPYWDSEHEDEDDEESSDYESVLWRYFPNFMDKYAQYLKYEDDCSLEDDHSVEFSFKNPPYMTGLKAGEAFVDLFFKDFNNQDNFYFSEATGMHTNLSYIGESGNPLQGHEYNFMKALLFLNHEFSTKEFDPLPIRKYFNLKRDEKPTKEQEIEYRLLPRRAGKVWNGDIKAKAIDQISAMLRADEDTQASLERHFGAGEVKKNRMMKRSIMGHLLHKRYDDLNSILSNAVEEKAVQMGSKNIGFNITSFKYDIGDRIEFRYPGGPDMTPEKIKEATDYYAYVVLLAAKAKYKEKEYITKLVGLLNNLNFAATEKAKGLTWTRKIRKGTIFTDHSRRRKGDTISWQNLIYYVIPQKVIKGHRHRGDASFNFLTDEDYVMFKKLDLKRREATFAYIVDRSGGSRPTRNGHPQNGLYIDEFSIPLKNFELDLQDGTMLPIGSSARHSFREGSNITWDAFKRSAKGNYTALDRAKVKFIQQVFAAVQKFPGQILVKNLETIKEREYERRSRISSIERVLSEIKPYLEVKAQKELSREEVIKIAREMSKSLDFYRPDFEKVYDDSRYPDGPHHPKTESINRVWLHDDDWNIWRKYKDKDFTDVDVLNATHQDVRDFMDKMDVSTQQVQDIEKKQVQDMVNKILGRF